MTLEARTAPSAATHARTRLGWPAVATGAATVVLGGVVLIGWHTRTPVLIQVLPSLVPMQYNTALGLMLAGGALVGLGLQRRFMTLLLGALAASLGSVTLAQYVTGADFGIDERFFDHYLTTLTEQPGRMAPTTALAMTLSAMAAVIGATRLAASMRGFVVALLSSPVVALGAGTLLGYLLGYTTPFSLSRHTYMAVHTASGFSVLGVGLFTVGWRLSMPGRAGTPAWVAMPVALAALTVTFAIGETLRAAEAGRVGASDFWVTWVLGPLMTLSVTLAVHFWRVAADRARTLEAAFDELQGVREHERALEERFRLAVEAAPAAMLLCDTEGIIQFANRRATGLFGWSVDALIGAQVDLLVPESARPGHAQLRSEFAAHDPKSRGMAGHRDLEALRLDGSRFPAEVILNPIPTTGGMMILAAVSDITARKEAEEQTRCARVVLEETVAEVTRANDALKRSNEELEQFAYVASHDLQEPLRMVSSYTELFGREYADQVDEEGQEMIGFAVDGARRMKALIDGLLQYSRVGRAEDGAEIVGLEELCDMALALFSETIRSLDARVSVAALPRLEVNPVEIEMVFRNLIGNALKFTGDAAPVIEIGAELDGDMWQLSVDDNGIGVDPEYERRIFQIFQRLHARAHYPGEGMGLALCQRIVERHYGTIWVEPSRLGGASFRFTLPVTARWSSSADAHAKRRIGSDLGSDPPGRSPPNDIPTAPDDRGGPPRHVRTAS